MNMHGKLRLMRYQLVARHNAMVALIERNDQTIPCLSKAQGMVDMAKQVIDMVDEILTSTPERSHT